MSVKTNSNSPRNVKLLPCVVYGSAFAMLVFYCIRIGWFSHPLIDRYVTGHPVSYAETMMLCVGLLALGMKGLGLIQERRALSRWQDPNLEELPFLRDDWAKANESGEISDARYALDSGNQEEQEGGEDFQRASGLIDVLHLRQDLRRETSPANSTLTQRMVAALRFIQNRKSAEGVEDHLKHLAGQDADAQHDSYSLIRLIVWAIPMLGFLGTVLGISEALGGLDLGANADLSALIGNLKSSLYVAFDTTALALTYGVVLMFFQFGLDRMETSFVQDVDRCAEDFILSSFATTQSERDPIARSVQRMGQALLKATFSLVEHQHDLWNESLTAAQDAWVSATENSANQADHVLREVVDGASDRLVEKLHGAMEMADQQLNHRWQQWQVTLSDNTRAISAFQKNATSHIEMLQQFFQNATNLSGEQRESIQHLIGHLDALVIQSRQLQRQQEKDIQQRSVREQEEQRFREEQRARQDAEEQAIRSIVRIESELSSDFIGPLSLESFREWVRRNEQEGLEEGWIPPDYELEDVENSVAEEVEETEPAEAVEPIPAQKLSVVTETEEAAAVEEFPTPALSLETAPGEVPSEAAANATSANAAETVSPLPTEFRIRPKAGMEWALWSPFASSNDWDGVSSEAVATKSSSVPLPQPTGHGDAGLQSPEVLPLPSETIAIDRATESAEHELATSREVPKTPAVPPVSFVKTKQVAGKPVSRPIAKPVAEPIRASREPSELLKILSEESTSKDIIPLVAWEDAAVAPSEPEAVEDSVEPLPVNPHIRSNLIPFDDAKVRRAS